MKRLLLALAVFLTPAVAVASGFQVVDRSNLGRGLTVNTPSGTTQTIDWNLGPVQELSLASASGIVTLTYNNPTLGADYCLEILQGGTARTLTYPNTVVWASGTAPVLSTTNAVVDWQCFLWDGTNYYGRSAANMTPRTIAASSTITGSNLSGTNTGDLTLGAVGSTPSSNGASLSSQVLTLQPADGTHGGVVSTLAQAWAGLKTLLFAYTENGSITAHAGGGQGSAVALVSGEYNDITVCASNLDSVILPTPTTAKEWVMVVDHGAQNARLYPQSGATIGSQSANTGITLYTNVLYECHARTTTAWDCFWWGEEGRTSATNVGLANASIQTNGQAVQLSAGSTLTFAGVSGNTINFANSLAAGLIIAASSGSTFLTLNSSSNTLTVGVTANLNSNAVIAGSTNMQGQTQHKVVYKTADYSSTTSDYEICVTDTSSTRTITLPAAAGLNDGVVQVVKNCTATASGVTVKGNGSETIDGSNTQSLAAWQAMRLMKVTISSTNQWITN